MVEQRILEGSVRLGDSGALTAWASLRWHGATFFDGTSDGGRTLLPVPLLLGMGSVRPDPRVTISKAQLAPHELEVVAGMRCAIVERSLFDEIVRVGRLRPGVIAVEMAVAAGLIEVDEFAAYVRTRPAWTGIPLARKVVPLVDGHCRSPQEVRLHLVWRLDAALPPALCNRAVFDRHGTLLGYPDLFDPVAGVVGEYDGADHRDAARHQSDVAREALFRDHTLEYFTVVGPDLADLDLVVRRMRSARARASFLPPEACSWTLDPPPWWDRPLYR
ncbi:MAG TPA: hypothetical protein VFJ89_06510 [Nocardioides sp.]|nr:hypothetical protein [Nocardioides sp.]